MLKTIFNSAILMINTVAAIAHLICKDVVINSSIYIKHPECTPLSKVKLLN